MLPPLLLIRIRDRRLHRLLRITNLTLYLLLDPLGSLLRRRLLRRRWCLFPHTLDIRHRGILIIFSRLIHIRIDLVFTVLLDEGCEILDCAGAAVVDGGVFGAGGEELDGGEALDLVGDVIGGCVDFGDGDLGGEGWVGGVEGG